MLLVGSIVGGSVGCFVVGESVSGNDGGIVGSGVGDPFVLSLQTHGIHSNPFIASHTSQPASNDIRQHADGAVPSDVPQLLLLV